MSDPWLVMPYETEPRILAWQEAYGGLVRLDVRRQWCGLKVYAVTVTDQSVPDEGKQSVFIAVPHAHEPAGTAGCMQVISELLTGRGLDDTATPLDCERALRELILCFVPDANPDGRRRAPVRFWTGRWASNEDLHVWMRGRDGQTGGMWQRFGRWSTREHEPDTIGMVYEQISSHEYVEPNRDKASSYSQLMKVVDDRYGLDRVLGLHQTEFEGMSENATVLLPIILDDLPAPIQREDRAWGRAVHEAWREAGGQPVAEPYPLNYGSAQGDYFRRLWGDVYHRMFWITSEVRNNDSGTPPDVQVGLCAAAIRATIQRMLAGFD